MHRKPGAENILRNHLAVNNKWWVLISYKAIYFPPFSVHSNSFFNATLIVLKKYVGLCHSSVQTALMVPQCRNGGGFLGLLFKDLNKPPNFTFRYLSPTVPHSHNFCIYIYLKGKLQREKTERPSTHWFTLQTGVMARAGSDCNQEPGTLSRSTMWIQASKDVHHHWLLSKMH